RHVSFADVTVAVAAVLVGAVWLQLRQGRPLPAALIRRAVTPVAVGVIVLIAAHMIELLLRRESLAAIQLPRLTSGSAVVTALVAIGASVFVVGSADAVSRAASDFPPPKVRNLRRAMWFVNGYSLIVIGGAGFVFALIVPAADQLWWHEAPLA